MSAMPANANSRARPPEASPRAGAVIGRSVRNSSWNSYRFGIFGSRWGQPLRPTTSTGFLVGGEARYLRKYEGIGLEDFAGEALFIGPTAYFQLSERSRLTLAWSVQAWGRSAQPASALDLVNFERHQARLIFGVNF